MFNKKSWRAFSIIMLAVIMTIVVLLLMRRESRMCMGIEIVPEAQITNGRQEIVADIGDYILFEGEEIAYDRRSNTVYIPQVITENTRPKDMKGSLELSLGEYTLKFIFDEQMQDFQKAVKENYKFTVAAVNDEVYTKINVIFTTLPVITITTGDFIGEEEGREVYKAQFKMWAPYDKGTGAHSIKTGDIEYHYRGNTSYYSNKKSYKLTFTDGEGVKNNIELLGMGEDDDWILGSMIYDDLKIKEILCKELWNQHTETADYNYKMTPADYAEFLVDDKYRGIYMVQRRLDKKYLELSENDILFKHANVYTPGVLNERFEIKYSPFSPEKTYEILENLMVKEGMKSVDANNFADVNLFMEFGSMGDNVLKNYYIVIEDTADGYKMKYVLWDTDISFGVVWSPNGFVYKQQQAAASAPHVQDTAIYEKTNPELYNVMAQNWAALREDVLSEKNIQLKIDQLYYQIFNSGAYIRELEKREIYSYGGQDTKEAIESYISQKLEIMDEKYLN